MVPSIPEGKDTKAQSVKIKGPYDLKVISTS
jgi:hypothetical protein